MGLLDDKLANLERALDTLDAMQEHQTQITRQLSHALAGMKWRENSHQWLTLDGTATGLHRFDLRKLFGGVPAQSLTVVTLNGATVTLRINGEPRAITMAADDAFVDETIDTVEVEVTGAGTGEVSLRAGAYVGMGA